MKKFFKIITKSVLTSLLAMLLTTQGLAQAQTTSNLTVTVSDTIAGYSALAHVSQTLENEPIEVQLTKPSGTQIIFSEETDENGELSFDIPDYHTHDAGIYHLAARFASMQEDFGTPTDFRVYPGDVSINRSQLKLNRTTAQAMSGDTVILTVQLLDNYGNPIKGHIVNIISSRAMDRVENISSVSYTNDNGTQQFALSSTTSGVSSYAVMDTTSNVTLESRAKVAYLSPISTLISRGGEASLLFASANAESTAEAGIISNFKFEDLPEQTTVNESLMVTVTAVDGLGDTITNYTGTIRFSSSDGNATLPQDYTFTEDDLGTHTFNLALSFATIGTQTISVMDDKNEELVGETFIEVASSSTQTQNTGTGATFTLQSPLEGTVSENMITVSGVTSSGLSVHIYDNDEKAAATIAGADGSFSYTTDPLVDGVHRISAIVVDSSGNTISSSNTVNVTIDTTAPTIDAITIEPEGDLNHSAPLTITLYSEPNLSQIAVLLNDAVTDLTEKIDQAGVYTATLTTPDTTGSYDIDVIMSDQLSNQVTYSKKTTITVTEEETTVLPDQVSGVTALAGEGMVTLSWEATESDTAVTNYKIHYGPSASGLYNSVETADASTSWQVRDLNNNFTYYFAVVAIDEDGDESGEQSVVIGSMPKSAVTQTVTDVESTTAVLHESAPEETPDSGPEMVVLFIMTGLIVASYYGIKKEIYAK